MGMAIHRRAGAEWRPIRDCSKLTVLLLRPGPGHAEQSSGYSADAAYMEDMEMQMPEPTAVEKLKYHLTETRLPPSRRKTYSYSHHVANDAVTSVSFPRAKTEV